MAITTADGTSSAPSVRASTHTVSRAWPAARSSIAPAPPEAVGEDDAQAKVTASSQIGRTGAAGRLARGLTGYRAKRTIRIIATA